MHKIVRKIRRAVLRDEPGYYDMFENPGERFFSRLYLHQIRQTLDGQGLGAPLRILDAGCQAGRLSIPLARDGHRVVGVDTSDLALRRCRRHAAESSASLEIIRADLVRWLPSAHPESFDVVLCSEVLYLRENHRALLQGLVRLIRPGGLCFISHRPTGYYLAEAFERRDPEAIRTVLGAKEGTLFGSYYNWQDREDLERIYPSLGIELLRIVPIGFLSWRAARPDALSEEEQDLLFQADTDPRSRNDCSGRYLLVCGLKQPENR